MPLQQTLTKLRVSSSMPKHRAYQHTQPYHHSHASRTAKPISNRMHAAQSAQRPTKHACPLVRAKPAPLSMKNTNNGPTHSPIKLYSMALHAEATKHTPPQTPTRIPPRLCPKARFRETPARVQVSFVTPFRATPPEITKQASTKKQRPQMPHHATPWQ